MSTDETMHSTGNGNDERKPRIVVAEAVAKEPSKAVRRNPARKSVPSYVSWTMAAAIVVAGTIGSLVLPTHKASVKTAETAPALQTSEAVTLMPEQQTTIAVEVVQRTSLQGDVTAPGKVAFNGNRMTPVFSQFNGRLVKLNGEVGMIVRAGQALGTIDTPDIVSSQADYQQALAAEHTARSALELATRVRQRAGRLASAQAIPARDLQQAEADESHAADDLQRAQSATAATRGRLQSVGLSAAEINRLASGERAMNRLLPLIAPINGTIIERKAGLGQVVQSGAGDALFMIADLSFVWVNADVYEDQLANIRVGTPVKIRTPAYANESFTARVDQIGTTLDPEKHTVTVRCVVANHQARLKPGMFASVILNSAASQSVLTIPASALVAEGDSRAVFVEVAPGHYIKRAVQVGSESGGLVIVRSGLAEGERVVVRGSLLLSSGQQAG